MEEYEAEVFKWDNKDGSSPTLVIKDTNGFFMLEAKNFMGKHIPEDQLESLGVFAVFD
jgi:hypothetical protein